jgi:hypothetical protein
MMSGWNVFVSSARDTSPLAIDGTGGPRFRYRQDWRADFKYQIPDSNNCGILNLKSRIWIWNLGSGIWNLILNLKSGIWNLESDLEFEIWNLESGIWNFQF